MRPSEAAVELAVAHGARREQGNPRRSRGLRGGKATADGRVMGRKALASLECRGVSHELARLVQRAGGGHHGDRGSRDAVAPKAVAAFEGALEDVNAAVRRPEPGDGRESESDPHHADEDNVRAVEHVERGRPGEGFEPAAFDPHLAGAARDPCVPR